MSFYFNVFVKKNQRKLLTWRKLKKKKEGNVQTIVEE